MTPITIRELRAAVYRAPLETPVETSFGVMHDRPMVVVTLTDDEGFEGHGEIWCNFPQVGAEHRARLATSVLAPILTEKSYDGPAEAWRRMTDRVAVLALQSGEPGPLANAVAGIDIALWDLAARKAGQPLWRMLGGKGATARVPVYASGLNPTGPERLAAQKRDEGYRAFKLKIGFGDDRDIVNIAAVRREVGEDCDLMVDANQAWTLERAMDRAAVLGGFDLKWLEEPLRSDRPAGEWLTLKASTTIPLAAGENFLGEARFQEAARNGLIDVVQPDAAKWGGLSRTVPIAREAIAAGLSYCPHYLGGGIGLVASAHALAAVGGDGLLEVDANPNPLREPIFDKLPLEGGAVTLPDAPGLGIDFDPAALEAFRVM